MGNDIKKSFDLFFLSYELIIFGEKILKPLFSPFEDKTHHCLCSDSVFTRTSFVKNIKS